MSIAHNLWYGKAMTTASTLSALDLQVQVLEMRMMGKSLPAIAQELGVTKGRVTRAHNEVLKMAKERHAKIADEYFMLTNARYDQLLSVWMPRALGQGTISETPNVEAAKLVVGLLREVRELNGIDRPKDTGDNPRLPPDNSRSPLDTLNINVISTSVPSHVSIPEPDVVEALPSGNSRPA